MAKLQGKVITVGVTGASGAIYAQALLRLLDADRRVAQVFLVASEAGLRLVSTELGIVAADGKKLPALLTGTSAKKFEYLPNKDIGASIASGSAVVDGMVIIPCSAGALGSIAAGTAADLLARAADVCLKERRPLILCVRETPFNRIHLRNMTLAAEAGATIFPVIPAFYLNTADSTELARQFVCRVLAHIGLPQPGAYVWKPEE